VRHRRDITDCRNLQTRILKCADGRVTANSRALDPDLDSAQPHADCFLGSTFSCQLTGEWRRLSAAADTDLARRRPGNHVALYVSEGDDRVIESRKDVRHTQGFYLLRLLAPATASLCWQLF